MSNYSHLSIEERCSIAGLAKPGNRSGKSLQLWIASRRPLRGS